MRILGLILMIAAAALVMSGCVTTTAPDGTTTTSPDAPTVGAVAGLVGQALARGSKDAF